MKRIVTITFNPAIDKSTTVPALLPDKKIKCAVPAFQPGGGGINVARAIVKLGAAATAVYLAGGHTGAFFHDLLEAEQVESIRIPIKGITRENLILYDASTREQFLLDMPGPTVAAEEWQHFRQQLETLTRDAAFVVASGSLPPGIPPDAFSVTGSIARKNGAAFVVDTSGEPLKLAAHSGVYFIKPNLGELASLTGKTKLTGREVVHAAQEVLRQEGCEFLVVSLGAAGAMVVTPKYVHRIQAPVVKKLGTVGAGDSMVAGIITKLAAGEDILPAVKYGVACGTAATMNTGTTLCKKEDADLLYRSME
ncbi:1-phosphofructokinase family hexose kinase [Chitinophaga qingshengii]|uniref:1-phosphofructokinase family hexose kinase n=1 Tax=Chitinophaga qingshengii TaxID=1569794 RepID=A0ABR7TIH4_9BACT|nr:1-phosphofructokinase family hexose kinase [Chitinophaga qingshengii]MBC9929790.1 1-phosphofructokinase family hexose kinase [Chitinophaga qingshengii]